MTAKGRILAILCMLMLFVPGNASIPVQAAEGAGSTAVLQQTERATTPENVCLDIDTVHVYENMKNSYSQGYIPVVENDTVHLTVPFVADGNLKNECLTVELAMSENAPFIYANYRKEVKKETYLFESGMEVYLFQCDISLEKVRKNGKYPVMVKATGYTGTGVPVKCTYRIFITITDGISAISPSEPGTEQPPEPGTEQPPEPGTEQPSEPGTEQPPEPEQPVTPGAQEPSEPETEEPSALPADGGIPGDAGFGGGSADYGGGSAGYGGGTAETEKIYHQPRLLLESNSLSGQRLQAGREKEFLTVFANKSGSESIYNLKVTLKPADNGISLSTTSFYFSRVYPQEKISLSAMAEAQANAAPGRCAVTFSFEYENEKGTVYNASEEVFLEIYQPAQAVLGGFEIAPKVYCMETVESDLQIRNTGKSDIYHVCVKLNAPGLFETETVQAGTLEAGAVFEGSLRIYVGNKNMQSMSQFDAGAGEEAYGQTAGTLTLTYEDAGGEIYTQTQEFTTYIERPQMVELKVEKEEPETNEWYAAVMILVTLLFTLILCVMWLRLKKSQNKVADLLAAKEHRRDV